VSDPEEDDSAPTIEIVPKRTRPEGSLPEIKIDYAPAGRATLEAIADELAPVPVLPRIAQSSSPEISVRESFAERDTLAAILAEASGAPESSGAESGVPEDEAVTAVRKQRAARPDEGTPLEIFEMVTFVVRGVDSARLASEPLRRRFVEERLLKRLPVASIADIDRVDVTPWTVPGTLVVRVWCKTLG
jgi:hypothetical protein